MLFLFILIMKCVQVSAIRLELDDILDMYQLRSFCFNKEPSKTYLNLTLVTLCHCILAETACFQH